MTPTPESAHALALDLVGGDGRLVLARISAAKAATELRLLVDEPRDQPTVRVGVSLILALDPGLGLDPYPGPARISLG